MIGIQNLHYGLKQREMEEQRASQNCSKKENYAPPHNFTEREPENVQESNYQSSGILLNSSVGVPQSFLRNRQQVPQMWSQSSEYNIPVGTLQTTGGTSILDLPQRGPIKYYEPERSPHKDSGTFESKYLQQAKEGHHGSFGQD